MDLHFIQLEILKELLFNPDTNFTALNTQQITSDLFAYHIRQLIKIKYVDKQEGKYILTPVGKEFANRLDVDSKYTKVEKQGKVSVIVHAFIGSDFDSLMVVETRLKEPFYGFKGGVTGKIKYGETIFQTAERELYEETGLKGDLSYHGISHHINIKNNEVVEDKYLFAFLAMNCVGNLKKESPGMKNELMLLKDYRKLELVYEGELDIVDMCIGLRDDHFIEVVLHPEKF